MPNAASGPCAHAKGRPSRAQGIIRRVQEDGPDRGNVDLDILPRTVRYRLRDVMEDVGALTLPSLLPCCAGAGGHLTCILLHEQGRISKHDVDARMLKALADLPVDLGIEAIDKFAMASTDTVRSKTGFMVRCLPGAGVF